MTEFGAEYCPGDGCGTRDPALTPAKQVRRGGHRVSISGKAMTHGKSVNTYSGVPRADMSGKTT